MNRIPVVNDEQRAGYGAPTTVVGAGLAPEAVYRAKYEAKDLGDAKPAAKKAAPKKKPAAKAKAKK